MKALKLLSLCVLVVGLIAVGAYAADKVTFKALSAVDVTPHAPTSAPAAWGDDCAGDTGLGVLAATGGTIAGTTIGMANDYGDAGITDGSCVGCCAEGDWRASAGSGPDVIGSFTVDLAGPWQFSMCADRGWPTGSSASPWDSSLMVLSGATCPGDTQVGCNGDACGLSSALTEEGGLYAPSGPVTLAPGTTYYLLVEGWSAGDSGDFEIVYVGPCVDNPECTARDGDLFCTGEETCDAGVCLSAGDPCEGTTEPVCDEATRACLACYAAAEPDVICGANGIACDGFELCDQDAQSATYGQCYVEQPCDFPRENCWEGTCETSGDFCNTADDCAGGGLCMGLCYPYSFAPCLVDGDCPYVAYGEYCIPDGGECATVDDCAFGAGWGQVCEGAEACVVDTQCDPPHCPGDGLPVYSTNWCGNFGGGQGYYDDGMGEISIDAIDIEDFPAGRELSSYSITIICRDGVGDFSPTGPYDITLQLWSSDPSGGPDAPIPGTTCFFADQPCGDGITGSPTRNAINTHVCYPSVPVTLPVVDGLAVGGVGVQDFFHGYMMTSDHGGFGIAGEPPLYVANWGRPGHAGLRLGYSDDWWLVGQPPNPPVLSWGYAWFGGYPYTSNFGMTEVCVEPTGPCCLPDAPFACEMLSEADCTAANGEFHGVSTLDNPVSCDGDADGDGVADICDNCVNDHNPAQEDCDGDDEGDACEASWDDQDDDGDGTCNGIDGCPDDPAKTDPGQCGCGNPDDDSDQDGTADCIDECDDDPLKIAPGICGCGTPDEGDEDQDGVLDCVDECPGVDDAVFAPECEGAIPTISEWGLVILALLLLVAGKVYFGRRPARA